MSTDPFAPGPIEPFPEDTAAAREHDHASETFADPVHEEVETHVDPAVADAVHGVRDRFGARGLRDLITLATYELEVAEAAAAALATPDVDVDEQAWSEVDERLPTTTGDDEAR